MMETKNPFIVPFLCILLMIGYAPSVVGQGFSISGRVVDKQGKPLSNVDLVLADSEHLASSSMTVGSALTKTGPNGNYEIESLLPGHYVIAVFMPGKEVVRKSLDIADNNVYVNFELNELSDKLDEITIDSNTNGVFGMRRLRAVESAALYDGKKNEVILLDGITANLATNNSRQIYARVPGLNIWESDGAGVQMGIGGRGLSPNRNSNFNTRQNGYDIAADALGYPESYYTPPAQALERIEIIRGAASLQYGTQFGGLLNFVFKEGAVDKPAEVTSLQTVGSFGFVNSFNSVGGTVGSVRYYGFYQYKHNNGWRPNEQLTQHTAYLGARYTLSDNIWIKPEYTYMTYLAQQPGGLTDAQFELDPRQSNRERNWFHVNWNLWSLNANYSLSSLASLNTRFFGLFAQRDALGNLGRIDRIDFGGNRDLLVDRFKNWGNETRFLYRYPLLNDLSVLLVGARYYDGFTDRRQGEGTNNNDADFSYMSTDLLEGSEFDLPSKNISLFAENIFNVTPKFSIVPGIRFEHINTEADGYYRNVVKDLAGNVLLDEKVDEQRKNTRSFMFFGVGLSLKQSQQLELYGNFSQNYRAINFNDIRVNIGSLEVDPDIKDERGYNVELGVRGTVGQVFDYDISLFHLSYEDRIGTILRKEPNPQFNNLVDRTFRFRTNIADAKIFGVESYAEVDVYKLLVNPFAVTRLSVFTNTALIKAEYARSEENGIEGNEVELVPELNLKAGLIFAHQNLQLSYQVSFVSEHFSDASNAIRTPTAIEGIIPAYTVMDASVQYTLGMYRIDAGVNNLTDAVYFTRRATGYPGPGIIPSNGRSVYLTVGVRI